MPENTSPRGAGRFSEDREVVVDRRGAVLVEDHGLLSAEVEGHEVVIVWNKEVGTANVFDNGQPLFLAQPAKSEAEKEAVRDLAYDYCVEAGLLYSEDELGDAEDDS